MRDVTNAGTVVTDRIGREAASHIDLEEALEAARYASHPYSTHPREVHGSFSKTSEFLYSSMLHVYLQNSHWLKVWILFDEKGALSVSLLYSAGSALSGLRMNHW